MLLRHLLHVQARPEFAQATLVVAIEKNLGWEGENIAEYLLRNAPPSLRKAMHVLRDGNADNHYGIQMSESMKKKMYLAFNEYLVAQRVRTYEAQVTVADETTPLKAREQLLRELGAYTREIIPGKKPGDRIKEKLYGKGGGATDDLAIAVQLNVVAYQTYRQMERA